MEQQGGNTRKRRKKSTPDENTETNTSSSAAANSKQWEPLTFDFQLDKPPAPNVEQNDIPFYVPEKQRRMHAKRNNNTLDNDFVITVYLPQEQQQQNMQSSSNTAASRTNAGGSNTSGNIFKVYSYRSTEMPSALSQSSSSSSSIDSSPIQRNSTWPIPPLSAARAEVDTGNASSMNQRRDRRYSFDFILHRENKEIDRRFNPFR